MHECSAFPLLDDQEESQLWTLQMPLTLMPPGPSNNKEEPGEIVLTVDATATYWNRLVLTLC